MPSRHSSVESREDATQLAECLGIGFLTIAIDGIFQIYLDTLAEPFAGREPDVTEENIQYVEKDRRLPITNRFRAAEP